MTYQVEFIPAAAVVGLITLLCVPGLSLLIALVIVTLAAMALLALAGAVLAAPYLLVRSLHRRWQARPVVEHRVPNEDRVPSGVPSSAMLSPLARS